VFKPFLKKEEFGVLVFLKLVKEVNQKLALLCPIQFRVQQMLTIQGQR